MRLKRTIVTVGFGAFIALLSSCASSSVDGLSTRPSSTIFSAESGGASGPGIAGDCETYSPLNIDAKNVAPRAAQVGIGAQANPPDALRAVLTHGSAPFFGGSGGSGVVGLGYPAAGWKQATATTDNATFEAPLRSGTAKLSFTRVGSRWLLSHAEKDC
jgi:hypothetical protein